MAILPIQIVDENDEPVGSATIFEARENGLIHRIARIMAENPDTGEILLQKRTSGISWPNCWDNSAAGHVDVGENYLTAAKRELFEEIGIETDSLQEIGRYFSNEKVEDYNLKRFNRLYKYETTATPTNLQAEEVSEVKWFSVSEV